MWLLLVFCQFQLGPGGDLWPACLRTPCDFSMGWLPLFCSALSRASQSRIRQPCFLILTSQEKLELFHEQDTIAEGPPEPVLGRLPGLLWVSFPLSLTVCGLTSVTGQSHLPLLLVTLWALAGSCLSP